MEALEGCRHAQNIGIAAIKNSHWTGHQPTIQAVCMDKTLHI